MIRTDCIANGDMQISKLLIISGYEEPNRWSFDFVVDNNSWLTIKRISIEWYSLYRSGQLL
jgi:hypothetical protein